MVIHRQLLEQFVLGSDLKKYRFNRDLQNPWGLGRRELKRQYILGMGGELQGKRRPNMAAHPFMRPAVAWRWPYIRQMITERLKTLIDKFEAAT
jgi:hypothetical protein